MSAAPPRATIVITTRNRKEELRRALASCFAQTVPVHVMVMDDASEDGTAQMVQAEFPEAVVLRSEVCLGLIAQRSRAAREARTEHIFSMDDDAEFGSDDTVELTLAEFGHPRVGAVAIPQLDTSTGAIPHEAAPADGKVWCVAAYTGTAHALRRSVFLKLGAYSDELVHQGEEGDYCMRMLAAGWITRLGRAPKILHHESPRRSFERMEFYGRRNDVRFGWRYAPWRWVFPHLLATTANGVLQAWKTRRPKAHIRGLACGWWQVVTGQARRTPVSPAVYHLFRDLKRNGPKRLDEIEKHLPPAMEIPA